MSNSATAAPLSAEQLDRLKELEPQLRGAARQLRQYLKLAAGTAHWTDSQQSSACDEVANVIAQARSAAPAGQADEQAYLDDASHPRDMQQAMQWIVGLRNRVDNLLDVINAAPVSPAGQQAPAKDRQALVTAALTAVSNWVDIEVMHARNVGKGSPGMGKKCEQLENAATAAIEALAAPVAGQQAAQVYVGDVSGREVKWAIAPAQQAPYSAPFTTDVSQCWESPETCAEPCQAAPAQQAGRDAPEDK